MSSSHKMLSIFEAKISDLQQALTAGNLTSVDLVSKYLTRIATFDSNGPRLNSVCVLNPKVFEEAQASDDYRASGRPPRPLEGIPYLVKDSFKVEDMTVAAGSPAFVDLVSSSDSAIVESLRAAGAIVLGKTNMPAMADGGGQRGVYGRAESPYNPRYLTTAFASGSSNGSGTSIAASFASFGFAGETVSSGRAPASNNALVGYSPSRGVIPIRGQWPLYSTCDVVTPHTRSMRDLFDILNVIVRDDPKPEGDFWRTQQFVPIPLSSQVRPINYHSLANPGSLRGKLIAVPKCFVGDGDTCLEPNVFTDPVRNLFAQARRDLEALGATLVETTFPLLEKYDKKLYPGQSANVEGFTEDWMSIERCKFIAMGWDDFLRQNGSKAFPNLTVADPKVVHPIIAPMDDPRLHTEKENHVRYEDMIDAVRDRRETLYDVPGVDSAARSLEAARRKDLELWMDNNGFDCLVFPTNGDVARADVDERVDSMIHALQDGVKYSNGGRALKHLGVPAVTVPMGTMSGSGMPVGLTFCGKGWSDSSLLEYCFAYETFTERRTSPSFTPALPSDFIDLTSVVGPGNAPSLRVETIDSENADSTEFRIRKVRLTGTVKDAPSIDLLVDDQLARNLKANTESCTWEWSGEIKRPKVFERYPTMHTVPKDQFLVRILAKSRNGRSAGLLLLID